MTQLQAHIDELLKVAADQGAIISEIAGALPQGRQRGKLWKSKHNLGKTLHKKLTEKGGFAQSEIDSVEAELLGSGQQQLEHERKILNRILDKIIGIDPVNVDDLDSTDTDLSNLDSQISAQNDASQFDSTATDTTLSASHVMTAKIAARNDKDDAEALYSYNGFLERLRRPGSRDLVEHIRRFLNSIMGPRGDGKPPRPEDEEDEGYPFAGTKDLVKRTKGFIGMMSSTMEQHQAWKTASEETSEKAKDGLEKYIMNKIEPAAFNTPIDRDAEEDIEEDKRLYERIQLLVTHTYTYVHAACHDNHHTDFLFPTPLLGLHHP